MPIVAVNGTDACVVDDDRMCVVGVGVVGEDDVLVVVVLLLFLVLVVSNMGAPAVNGLSVNTSFSSPISSSMYTVCVCVCVGFGVCTSCNNVYVLVVVVASLLSSKLKPNGCSTCCSLLL